MYIVWQVIWELEGSLRVERKLQGVRAALRRQTVKAPLPSPQLLPYILTPKITQNSSETRRDLTSNHDGGNRFPCFTPLPPFAIFHPLLT